ncbi:glycerate kinase [Lutimonas halocynthiae]|uniref:glycerate kinase n=1 Tax=Lutimonas halocynthiae TaxID=1446477 RepID=UPI0025B4B260|nr:glycerate kinase [Lutimonas halocynthiae]MDN3643772.1 glycerate kinase [Lutimonas halocynthiae]
MKIVIAPDKFRGSLTGIEFCWIVKEAIWKIIPDAEIVEAPVADGGDGTLSALESQVPHGKKLLEVHDPLFRKIEAAFLYNEDFKIAFVEMAEASGLRLLKEDEYNCSKTTTYGTGELIKAALDAGAEKIILGVGGSATCDCGMGMAAALGYEFYDAEGKAVEPIGENLSSVKEIRTDKVDPRVMTTDFEVACDVISPLYGEDGAAYIYGPQKGASKEEIEFLDKGLRDFNEVLIETFNKDINDIYGAGAAGGMGAGALTFLNGELRSGIEMVKEMIRFDKKIKDADWVVTGEGKLDFQTLTGKAVKGVSESAQDQKIPVAVFCGRITLPQDALSNMGIQYSASVMLEAIDYDDAIKNGRSYLDKMATDFALRVQRDL